MKLLESLTVQDLSIYPVWSFVNDDQRGETLVRPVKRLPVKSLSGKLVGTTVGLSGGVTVWAMLGNVDVTSATLNEHLLTLSVVKDGVWFTMARYHDPDWRSNGPSALAAFLGLSVEQVFPISYDLSSIAIGTTRALVNCIPAAAPEHRLSRAEIIKLAVEAS